MMMVKNDQKESARQNKALHRKLAEEKSDLNKQRKQEEQEKLEQEQLEEERRLGEQEQLDEEGNIREIETGSCSTPQEELQTRRRPSCYSLLAGYFTRN